MSLPPADQAALLFPIKAKGAVTRISPAGNPDVNSVYSNSMEQGRFLEASIADANTQLLQSAQDLKANIAIYNQISAVASAGNLGQQALVPGITAAIATVTSQIAGLVAQVQQNITKLAAMEASMLQMVQANLNAIANLLNNICNWGIPPLPSIPNLLPDQIWNWNGFQFSPLALFAALKSNTNFNFNFQFSECVMGLTAPSSTFTGDPLTTTSYSGNVFGTSVYNPPYGNAGSITPASQDLNDPVFIAQ